MSGGMKPRPIDINHSAVWDDIDGYGIKDRKECFEKVVALFHHFQANGTSDE